MDADPFIIANHSLRRTALLHRHQQQSKVQILRSQLGFNLVTSSKPSACRGCANYHGVAYGYDRATRSVLICAIHPKGWYQETACPDWTPEPQ